MDQWPLYVTNMGWCTSFDGPTLHSLYLLLQIVWGPWTPISKFQRGYSEFDVHVQDDSMTQPWQSTVCSYWSSCKHAVMCWNWAVMSAKSDWIVARFLSSSGTVTHWSPDKIVPILQITFSYAFPWTRMLVFWFKIHLSLFLCVQLSISQHWFR